MKSKTLQRIIRTFPNVFWPLKVLLVKRQLEHCGTNVKISPSTTINFPESVSIGDDSFINERFYCSVHKKLTIGKRVMFGPDVMIIGGDHDFSIVGKHLRFIPENPKLNYEIVIEDDVWIAARTTILKSVSIGEGAIIGSNSLVTKAIPPYTIAFGIPTKIIRPRFTKIQLEKHLFAVNSKYCLKDLEYIYKTRQ